MDSAKSLIDDRTHLVLVSGKLELPKKKQKHEYSHTQMHYSRTHPHLLPIPLTPQIAQKSRKPKILTTRFLSFLIFNTYKKQELIFSSCTIIRVLKLTQFMLGAAIVLRVRTG